MPAPCPAISLSHLPPTHLLHARLTPVQIGTYTYWLITHRARLAPATTATLFLANVSTQKRGELELRKKGLLLITPTTDPATIDPSSRHSIRLVRLEWLDKSFQLGAVQDLEPYTVTVGEVASAAEDISVRRKRILESAKADRENAAEISKRARFGPRTERERGVARILAITKTPGGKPALKRQESREGSPRRDLPAWVVKKSLYSCCRSTPKESPNEGFLAQLKEIRHSRHICSDETGVRAYSTSIAAIRAYPFPLETAAEVRTIPGCDVKMSALFEEFMDSSSEHEKRRIPAVAELEANEDYRALKTFESIFGIGPDTATKFFYDLRFKSINDVKNHWSNLTRNQQIGVKYHDEFLAPVLRPEAELIAEKITEHARRLVPGAEIIIAGGYRRGESDFHDVDILISHAKEGALPGGFLLNLLKALEKRELISYTLSVSASGLQRGEDDWSGSDGLDTALLVWAGKKRKDGAEQVHRRVDIVVAPTVCAGTALLGWTGGTTFERDLRQWCQRERGWKFSSDGVWKGCERVAGTDGWEEGESWQDVEKRVMNAVGIGWRPASERCTG